MNDKYITIKSARQHNLKNLDLALPRDSLVVITGLSGSGKSSLAFDTIYAEGQRRYVESLSAYARQFLEQMSKPDVDSIEGLPPTIAIEQRSSAANPRSTVATTTEIYDYLRLLFARVGEPFCYKCGRPVTQQSAAEIVDHVMSLPPNSKVMILAPRVRGRKGAQKDIFQEIRRGGFVRVRVDGSVLDIRAVPDLDPKLNHTIEVVVDRLIIRANVRSRLADSVELALKLSDGILIITHENGDSAWEDDIYSEKYACAWCGISIEELAPRLFSFNSPYGACKTCDGLGTLLKFDPDLVIPDQDKSLMDGAIEPWRMGGKRTLDFYQQALRSFSKAFNANIDIPYRFIEEEAKKILLFGAGSSPKSRNYFEGVIPNLEKRFKRTESDSVRKRLQAYMGELPCPKCKGARLRPEALAVRINDANIYKLVKMTVADACKFFMKLELQEHLQPIGAPILKEIRERLRFMNDVGLGYLTLNRSSASLAGGEAQRIRLATQIGSGLVGVAYVLDEPSIGLHQRDNNRLLNTLRRLRDIGNSVIVVEHDEETIRSADYIVDLGPGAGKRGGEIVAQGSLKDILSCDESLTGKYMSRELCITPPVNRRKPTKDHALVIQGAREHNLKKINVDIPLGLFVSVTGVSGSGKSTLVDNILRRALARKLHRTRIKPGAHDRILGADLVDKVIEIDQSPIGRTPRSNPATYTGAFDLIRQLFARLRESRIRGYKPGRFSFNVRGGRCEACQGQGTKKIEMHFLPDIYVTCEVCKGTRFDRETLEITYRGKNIADVLDMRVTEALDFFANFPKIKRILQTLSDVGLGYVELGQSSTTLSGGEAQRVKLASELARPETGNTLYILDEPTTGLHFADVERLLSVLNRLVDMGNTVLVIEHNLDVIKSADWVIDLGPEGGNAGGKVVAFGTPEKIARARKSHTGKYLSQALKVVPKKPAKRTVAALKIEQVHHSHKRS